MLQSTSIKPSVSNMLGFSLSSTKCKAPANVSLQVRKLRAFLLLLDLRVTVAAARRIYQQVVLQRSPWL
jgi:hypothetical protein